VVIDPGREHHNTRVREISNEKEKEKSGKIRVRKKRRG
jgi:hypothetical protein